MTTLPLADARAQLSKLVEEASSTHERIEITKNGHRAAVLIGADDYDWLIETISVLSDSEMLSGHLQGLKDIESGDLLTLNELAAVMKAAGQASEGPYRLLVARPASDALPSSPPEKVALAVVEFVTGPLLDSPHRVGKPLREPLAPSWSARRGSYRVIYLIDEETRTVTVTIVAHRSDAYRT